MTRDELLEALTVERFTRHVRVPLGAREVQEAIDISVAKRRRELMQSVDFNDPDVQQEGA